MFSLRAQIRLCCVQNVCMCVCVYDAMRCDAVCTGPCKHTQQTSEREGARKTERETKARLRSLSLPILESLCIFISRLLHFIKFGSILRYVRVEYTVVILYSLNAHIQFSNTLKVTAITHAPQTHYALISPIPKRHLLRLSALGVFVLSVFEFESLSFYLPSFGQSMILLLCCLFFSFVCSFFSVFIALCLYGCQYV